MPSSVVEIIPPVIKAIQAAKPKTVLDVGVGFGKWGHLIREYTDVWDGNFQSKDWQVHITGVEAFEGYVDDGVRHYYDEIVIGDALGIVPTLQSHDIVIAMDMIEHQDKDRAIKLLQACIDCASMQAIFSIPLGVKWLGANKSYTEINPWEEHKSAWESDELESLFGDNHIQTSFVDAPRGPIGIFNVKGNG